MLNRIIDWAIENRLLVLLALASAMVGAVLLIPRLNLDAFPDVTNVQVVINSEAPGLAAEEVEQLITFPIEAVRYSLPDVEEVGAKTPTPPEGITVGLVK
jgi:cobalt-zinc-cadmium resistance protein CzcA